MESANGKISEEPFLKIDAIWSESQENFEKLLIKEEIVSDIEPDSTETPQEGSLKGENTELETESLKVSHEAALSPDGDMTQTSLTPVKKTIKSKMSKSEMETNGTIKSMCRHDPKYFKIVKRRLRCGFCKAMVCPECCKVIVSTVQNHLLGTDVCDSGFYCCKVCSLAFRSVCALQAHIRIHTMNTPYVCPDCGLIYNNMYFLILHLINKCFHVYKIVRYKCKSCSSSYFSPDLFLQHIGKEHLDFVFRCSHCSSLFTSFEEFRNHMNLKHQKLKVQYLDYFRCCLCSNMVIPRFMYHKHLEQHRTNLQSYEVEYQCVCSSIFGFVGTFRAHIQNCEKKGILPKNWSFLQKKLKIQEKSQTAIMKSKSEVLGSEGCVEEDPSKGLGLAGSDRVVEKYEMNFGKDKIVQKEGGNKILTFFNNENTGDEGSDSEKRAANSSHTIEDKSKVEGLKVCVEGGELKLDETQSKVEEDHSKEVNGEAEMVQGSEGSEKINEREQGDEDSCKLFYDHIPCDHLGYVKTQESTKKESLGVSTEKVKSPGDDKSYHIVTELDEKTGLITSKKVFGDALIENEYEEDRKEEEPASKVFVNDKIKFKLGNSFFSCPFCIVMFPKHNSTFQQFRLHVECYHPDAALNITLSDGEVMGKSKSQSDVVEEEGQDDSVKKLEKNRLGMKKKSSIGKRKNDEVTLQNKESSEKVSQEMNDDEEGKNHKEGEEEKNPLEKIFEEEKNKTKESEKHLEESDKRLKGFCPKKKGAYWTVKLALHNSNENSRVSFDEESRNEITENTNNKEIDSSRGREKEDTPKPSETFKNDGVEVVAKTEKEFKVTQEKPKIESGNVLEQDHGNVDKDKDVRKISGSDFEDSCDNSKESNWSAISDTDNLPSGNQKTVPAMEETLTKSKDKSRRESEVWSEFYETLKVAEKLKKKPLESKKSLVSDYSTKRKVKKPKRYRESSESFESENSESENGDFLGGETKSCRQEENGEEDKIYFKKKKLLRKLESVDSRFVDYLFDLINEKEKSFELYKKHSSLGAANRYSQNLRSYRKKVLNGIKHRGRPVKMMRYKDLVKTQGDVKGADQLSSEKRRGRPRKLLESGSVHERRRSDKEVDFIEKNFEREENFKEESSPSKRKRKLSSKLQYYKKINLTDEKDDFSSGQVITTKSATESNKKFSCAVCKEAFPEAAEFREHIVVHRMEENSYQCMECGECFVVRPSLEKHLHAFHKIKNTDRYITENQCTAVKKELPEADDEPLKENQCKVCKDQFDRPIDLTKHFRIHGMAFLREFRKEGKTK